MVVTSSTLEGDVIPQPDLPITPYDFVGRKPQIDDFRQSLQQGLIAGRTSSFAVLSDWGIGKTSLMLKFAALCSEPEFAVLPVFISASNDIHDYLRFAETLLGRFADALLVVPNMPAQVRTEVQEWRFKRVNLGGTTLERETPPLFLSSGSSLLGDTLKEAWDRFLRPAQMNGAIFFLDDLQNITAIQKTDLLQTITDQFRSLGIDGMNCSIYFSATADYFSETKGPADPTPRFYTKLCLKPFIVEETIEYAHSVLGTSPKTTAIAAAWLHEKTLGHPYFVAFVCRHLTASESEIQPDQLETIWPAIFDQLRREKFRPDTSQLSAKKLDLIHRFASLGTGEFSSHPIRPQIPKGILHASSRSDC